MSEEKLRNEEFDIKRVDGNVLSGDSNKIKLKITSYAVILEVQEAFMQEEIKAQEDKQAKLEQKLENNNLSFKEKIETKKKLVELSKQINNLKDVFEQFSDSRTRFMEIAKKALKLPEENLKQLAENGSIKIEGEKIDIDKEFEKAQNVLMDAQDTDNVFTNVDSEAIKEEVNRAMMEREDTNDINVENIDSKINNIAKETKEKVDNVITNRIGVDDALDLLNNEEQKILIPDVEKPVESRKDNPSISPTIDFDVPPISGEMGEWTTQPTTDDKDEETKPYRPHVGPFQPDEEVRTPAENNESIFGQDQPTTSEYNIPNLTQNQNDSETERKYTTLGKVHNNQGVDFGGDTSFKQILTSRQEGLNERSRKVSNLRTEVGTLEQTAKDKKERLAEATRKSEQDAADMASMAKQLEELKRLDEEEAKLSSEETTLNDRKSELNSEISGYDEKIDEIEKQNAANLEKYRAMQEEINKYIKGKTPDDDGQYGGAGGRRM